MLKKVLIGILTHFFIFVAQASPILLENGKDHYEIDFQADVLKDPSGGLTIEDVNNPQWNTQFKKRKKGDLNFGFSKSTFWIRLKIKDLSKKKWALLIIFPGLNAISFYKKNNDKWKEYKAGNSVPVSEWEIKYKDFSFYLNKIPEATYFIKVKSQGIIKIPIVIKSIPNFNKFKSHSNIFFGLFFGILCFSIIYNLIIGILIRSKSFLIFSSYVFFVGLLFLNFTGFGRFLFPNKPFFIAGQYFPYVINLVLICFFAFVYNFLKVQEEKHLIKKIFLYFFWVLLSSLVIIFLLPFHWKIKYLTFLSFLMQLINVSTAVIFFRKKLEAKIYLCVFSVTALSNIIQQLALFGVLPFTFLTSNSLAIGVLFSVVFFALTMIERLNYYQTSLFTLEKEQLKTTILLEKEKRDNDEAIQNATKENLRIIQMHVKKQTEELNMALDKLKKDHDKKATSYAKFGHEMRTPLNAIIGFSTIIEKNRQALSEKDLIQYIRFINSSGNALLKLVNEIHDYSLISIGELTFVQEEVNLHILLKNLHSFYLRSCLQKGLSFTLEDNSSTIPKKIFLDEVRLKQVLNNLLSNALKFTTKGSIKFRITAVKNDQNKEYYDIRFDIQDTGLGISEENLKKIFESFSQIYNSEKMLERGRGLSLDISKSIIEKMNGTLLVESKEKEGSTFSVLLKNVREVKNNEVSTKKNDLYTFNFSKALILIADDEPKNIALLIAYLKDSPFSIKTAADGKELLKMAFDLRPDLIITDFLMPSFNADSVAKKLKESPQTKQIPIIVVSALNLNDNTKNLFDSYLHKPLDKDVLLSEMANYLDHQKVKKEKVEKSEDIEIKSIKFYLESKDFAQKDVLLLKEIKKELIYIYETMNINYCENFCQNIQLKIKKTGLASLNDWFDTLESKVVSFQIDDLKKMAEDGIAQINNILKKS